MGLNRALDQAFSTSWPDNRAWVPAIDVVEQRDAYLVYAELPGVDPSRIGITFEQNVLTIRGSKPSAVQASAEGEVRVYAAEFSNGLLQVRVPKAQAAQPRRIEVKPAASGEMANGRAAEISNN